MSELVYQTAKRLLADREPFGDVQAHPFTDRVVAEAGITPIEVTDPLYLHLLETCRRAVEVSLDHTLLDTEVPR